MAKYLINSIGYRIYLFYTKPSICLILIDCLGPKRPKSTTISKKGDLKSDTNKGFNYLRRLK